MATGLQPAMGNKLQLIVNTLSATLLDSVMGWMKNVYIKAHTSPGDSNSFL
jgi:hypothetical protein